MAETPLILPTLVILLVVGVEWRASAAVAATAAACSLVLLTAAFAYPGWSAGAIVDSGPPALAVAVVFARILGAACFLWVVVRVIRALSIPW